MLLPHIGEAGQRRLSESCALVIGCGALGTVVAEALTRAGVGRLKLVDRDVVEMSNLQRQVLFDESDARAGIPKAVAAATRLRAINSSIEVQPLVLDVDSNNITALVEGASVILDGTDNVETRYLINDASVKTGVPWIYGACVGTEGRTMTVLPGATACLRCVFPDAPAGSELPTCDTAGVLGPAAGVIGSLQAASAIKLLSGNAAEVALQLSTIDLWSNRFRGIDAPRRADCPACVLRQFDFLDSPTPSRPTKLCGREAVQIRPTQANGSIDLGAVAARLRAVGDVVESPYFVRCDVVGDSIRLTVFPDGRALVHGTSDVARARSLHARYVGA